METLSQYFLYNNDYSNIKNIFVNLSRQLKIIHEHGMIIPNLNSESIVVDDDFSFSTMEGTDNFSLDQRKNMISFAKIILGTYLSLPNGFKDFSNVNDEWFVNNINDICSSIADENFDSQYFKSIFLEGSNEYYSDYIDRKNQEESLSSKSNIQGYKKVLANAASKLYQEQVFDEEDLSIDQKKASINSIFYPLLVGGILLFTLTLLIIFRIIN